jgi:hypothetical protein
MYEQWLQQPAVLLSIKLHPKQLTCGSENFGWPRKKKTKHSFSFIFFLLLSNAPDQNKDGTSESLFII